MHMSPVTNRSAWCVFRFNLKFLLILLASSSSFSLAQTATNIQVNSTVLQPSVKRLGVNLGDWDYYDSGQILKNLVFANPGFEGLKYRSILHCSAVSGTTCTDDNDYSPQPTGFWTGGTYRVVSGTSAGATGTVKSSTKNTAGCSGCGQIIQFDKTLSLVKGDYVIVTNGFPGTAQSGWLTDLKGNGTLTTEFSDLSSETPGKQALRMTATGSSDSARVTAAYDTMTGLSFLQMNGQYRVSFRAKGVGGSNQLAVSVQRLASGEKPYISQTITLTSGWADYNLDFTATEDGSSVGPIQLNFSVAKAAALLDDVSLTQTDSDSTNPTAFRDDVVNALKELKPGVIRMMASYAELGADIPDQLAQPFARYREGYSTGNTKVDDIPYGIHEFLQLCATVGADPWLTIPTATTPEEMTELVQYLQGTGSDAYSRLRIARGQTAPWTSVFDKIHIELGNETWNGVFKGEVMIYPAYPQWANQVFGAARSTSGYNASKYDLVLSGWSANPGWTAGILQYATQQDSIDIAPYLLYSADNVSTVSLFQSLFAQPEMFNSTGGQVANNLVVAARAPHPTNVSVYETNMGTMVGNITQTGLDALAPSQGAGVAVADNMLQMMRAGVQYQNVFCLSGYQFKRSDGNLVRLWGEVVDMGTTNRRRPQFYAHALANSAVGGSMVQTVQTGGNPVWNQLLSSDNVVLSNAHYIQSFAFVNGKTTSLVLFNLSLGSTLPVTFSGVNAPTGNVQVSQLASASIIDNNEFSNTVQPTTTTATFNASTAFSLPPHSMTVLTWGGSGTTTPPGGTVATPAFSVAGGSYTSTQTVTISDATGGATIYYTTDGTTPTTSSTKYTGPVTIGSTKTLKAIAIASGYTNSAVASATYTITLTAATPVFSLSSGTYSSAQKVTITDTTGGATIYYTTNGTTPTTLSAKYTGAITIGSTTTLKALAAANGYATSNVASAVYTISTVSVGGPSYPKGFTTTGIVRNGSAVVTNGLLQLTNGDQGQIGSAWYAKAVPVNSFTTTFTFKFPTSYGDGFTFTIQDSPKTVGVTGGNSSSLGYKGIPKSVAVKFDLYDNEGEGPDSTGIYTNGALPTIPATSVTASNINFHSGHTFSAQVSYSGTTLTLKITDLSTNAVFTKSYSVNIPAVVGGTTAYIGFTGSTGKETATQQILTWTYGN